MKRLLARIALAALAFGLLVLAATSIVMKIDPESHLGRGYLVYVAKKHASSAREWLRDRLSSEPGRENFTAGTLTGTRATQLTSLDFGPDGRLYIAQQNGRIRALTVERVGAAQYRVASTETIDVVRSIPNHDDRGRPEPGVRDRQLTGLLVTGTAAHPQLYVTSSDPRIGAGPGGRELDLDTNSGVISIVTKPRNRWVRRDLVRGLPRSEENHSTNGLALDRRSNTLYVAQGGNTNKGAPSREFAFLPQYALSSAILAVDLDALAASTYDLPTLGERGPFGGDDGRNQARLVPGGPVRVYAAGFRNPYDVVLTESGRLYTVDNGANEGWGDEPAQEGPGGRCTNAPRAGGSYDPDTLHLVSAGYYGGHPNPTRGSRANVFGAGRLSPVARAVPIECDYVPAQERGLAQFEASTNGIAEYTASNLDGALRGDLLTVSFDNHLYRVRLQDGGTGVERKEAFADVDGSPLDVIAQGDDEPFPGTIWIARYDGKITVLEPDDFREGRWATLAPTGLPRAEVSYAAAGRRLFLAGAGTTQQRYDPTSDTWRRVAPLPAALDHIQSVVVAGKIYYVGGLRRWPAPHVSTVYVYDPVRDTFSRGAPMPRGRGAGGVAVHGGRIYYAGGLHDGDPVAWFDVYDPRTKRWSKLPDMPRARDHFHAVVADGRLFVIGGRAREIDATLDEVDAYDFATGRWTTGLAKLPTARGGFAAASVGGQILVIGGERGDGVSAAVEAYDPRRDEWRALAPMPAARHGIQAAVCGGAVYVAGGGTRVGGGAATDASDVFFPPGAARGCGN